MGQQNTLERKVYSGWAFDANANEKAKIDREIYNDLKEKVRFLYHNDKPTRQDFNTYTYIESVGRGYAHKSYRVLSNPHNLTTDELALCCDKGNLCFGYRTEGNIIKIHTD